MLVRLVLAFTVFATTFAAQGGGFPFDDHHCTENAGNCNDEVNGCKYGGSYCFRCTDNQIYDVCVSYPSDTCYWYFSYLCGEKERSTSCTMTTCVGPWSSIGDCDLVGEAIDCSQH